MTGGRRWLLAGFLAGALLRVMLLPLAGTGDVVIWKVWSANASRDLTGVYGVGGAPVERRVLHWQGHDMTVDYPPVALYELATVGWWYRHGHPEFEDSAWLNAAVKMPGVLAELALALGLWFACRRHLNERAAGWCAMALWLNPAILLDGAALGYLDALMAVPLTIATLLAWRGRAIAAGVLLAVAVLTKAQAVFAAPALLAILMRRGTWWRPVASFVLAGAATGCGLIAPYVLRGAWANLVQALGRLATHDMVSGQAANIWWIVTWVLRVIGVWPQWTAWQALSLRVEILSITRVTELGYPDVRTIGLVLVAAALAWACLRLRRVERGADAVALVAWCLYAYALLAAQVHENHLAPAVFLLAPAAAASPRYRPVFWLVSGVVAANLYLFYGLGDGWPPLVSRSITGIDATVVLSLVSVLTFAWFTAILARPRPAPSRPVTS